MLNWMKKHWEALAIGAGAGVVGLILWEKRSAAATPVVVAPAVVTPPAPSPPSSGTQIILVPNVPITSYGARIGEQISVGLPGSAYWINNGSGPASGNDSVTFIYQGPGTVNYTWVDATMQPQTTALTFYTNAF